MARILVLDDDADLRELLSEALLAFGASSCLTAGAVSELQRQETEVLACDVAILDINLGPQQPSGVDAYRWFSHHGFAGRILFLTGHAASHPLVEEAAKIAQAPILVKPVDSSRLVELVQEHR